MVIMSAILVGKGVSEHMHFPNVDKIIWVQEGLLEKNDFFMSFHGWP
jgi:hypothetical protein